MRRPARSADATGTSGFARTGLGRALGLRMLAPVLVAAAAAVAASAASATPLAAVAVGVGAALPFVAWAALSYLRPVRRRLNALDDGVRGLQEGDFSLRLASTESDELGRLADVYNQMADALRAERQEIYERELLLDTVLQGSPVALVLSGPTGRVAFANRAARALLFDGRRLEGNTVSDVFAGVAPPLRDAALGAQDALVSVATDGEEEVYRVVARTFQLNSRPHTLHLLERLTPELRRREVDVWKKVIRVMSHELNNSLAPIRSLVRSARHIVRRPDHAAKLDGVFDVIEDRATHLAEFVESYARFARLPDPQRVDVEWAGFLESVRDLYPFHIEGRLPEAPCRFDPGQMQQVVINLLKNASEAGSPPDEIGVAVGVTVNGHATLQIRDRGPGMSPEAMARALVPFHSGKATTRGVGLALSREILEAHGGGLRLENRPGGGLVVTCWFPAH